jgi:predicted  nucleic acid-binding Zn-ribbon protein
MKINIETQKNRLAEINNQMTLLMKEKKAIQHYIDEETNRLIGIKSLKNQIIDLYNDPVFIKEHGRKRYYWEIGNIVGYSQSSIQRVFDEEKKTK